MNMKAAWRALLGLEEKASRTAPVIVQYGAGQPKGTPRDYNSFAREAYQKNIIAYRCINLVAKNAAAIPWCVYQGKGKNRVEVEQHALLDLLSRPNPLQGGAQMFETLFGYYLIAGNAYLESVSPFTGVPKELYALRPDRMKVVPSAQGLPQAYVYAVGSRETRFAVDALTGMSREIMHAKTFNPVDDWYGMSPIEAACFSLDQHNEAGRWNSRMLFNGARPSGALVYNPGGDAPDTLTTEQREALRAELERFTSGSENSGKPMILEGGLDWREMSLSPKDMDWLAGKDVSAREIALAFHVPPQLVGIEGSLTFANFEQARLALYDDAVLPLLDAFKDELNRWLVPQFGDNLCLEYDADEIPALEPRRREKWETVKTADFLTVNEKRMAVGYEPIDGGDMLLVNAGSIPLDTVADTGEPSGADAAADAENAYGDTDNGAQDDTDDE